MALKYVVDFEVGQTAAEEHANILRVNRAGAALKWELGARLARSYDKGHWRELADAPDCWSDYLLERVNVAVDSAYRYMRAAEFPRSFSVEQGVEKMALLSKIVGLTGLEQSPAQWLAMTFPTKDGTPKMFGLMTAAEADEAYRLLKKGAKPGKPAAPRAKNPEAMELEQKAEAAVEAWLTPEQVVTRRRDGKIRLDVRDVPSEVAKRVFEALAAALPG